MKIGVVGCGALGSFYGARFWRAGHDVHFLLRSDYAVVRERGVLIESDEGGFIARPRTAQQPGEIGVCELVLIGLKTTANSEFPRLLPPLVGPDTQVLSLQNGLGNEAAIARIIPVTQILGGLCFVCLNRLAPGRVRHLGRGHVLIGEYQRPPSARTRALAELFAAAGVDCAVSDDLEKAHWEKLVWNIPFNGLGVAGIAGQEAMEHGEVPAVLPRRDCLATDELLRDARWTELVRGLMLEVIHAAAMHGHVIPETLADKMIERTRALGAYRASTLVDFERGLPLELEGLFFAPLRQAQSAGASTPQLNRLCAVLEELDRRRASVAGGCGGLRGAS